MNVFYQLHFNGQDWREILLQTTQILFTCCESYKMEACEIHLLGVLSTISGDWCEMLLAYITQNCPSRQLLFVLCQLWYVFSGKLWKIVCWKLNQINNTRCFTGKNGGKNYLTSPKTITTFSGAVINVTDGHFREQKVYFWEELGSKIKPVSTYCQNHARFWKSTFK